MEQTAAKTVNIHTAKTHLSRLVDEAAAGAEIVIAKSGKPVARLVPLRPKRGQRRLGGLAGQIWIADDFNAPLPDDIVAAFYGERP